MVELYKIVLDARNEWQNKDPATVSTRALVGSDIQNALVCGDNIAEAKRLALLIAAGEEEPFDLIYMDPPYYTKTDLDAPIKFSIGSEAVRVHRLAFSDRWHGPDGFEKYLKMLAVSFVAAHELLKETGSLWIHLDRHAVHYAKVIADDVFGGPDNLINEVIWTYKSGGSSKKRFSNKHDNLLFYAKNPKKYKFFQQREKSYNRNLKPYRFKGVKEYKDECGWYTQVNMKDVWDIPMVGRTSSERLGYATQKPEALLQRVVESCTQTGDFCLDMFGGAGTFAAVCERTGRRWHSVDLSSLAIATHEKRLKSYALMASSEKVLPWEKAGRISGFSANADIYASPEFENRNILRFSLKSYVFSKDETAQFDEMDRERIMAGAKANPLQFVLLIQFDFSAAGQVSPGKKVFAPDVVLQGDDIRAEIIIPIKPGVGKRDISVRIVDILGGECSCYLDKV